MNDAHLAARQAQRQQREAYQRWLDAQLTPASDEPAEQVAARWEPMDQFLKEGPDVGERHEAEYESPQRIN